MYSNNILNVQKSTRILNAYTKKKSGNLLNAPRINILVNKNVSRNNILCRSDFPVWYKTLPVQFEKEIYRKMIDRLIQPWSFFKWTLVLNKIFK